MSKHVARTNTGNVVEFDREIELVWTRRERAALAALQPSQLLKVGPPDHASALASKQLLAWFLGVCGTRREQHLLKYAGPCCANPQQCEFAFGNNQSLLAFRSVSTFTSDCGCQAVYVRRDPRLATCTGCQSMPESVTTNP